MAKTGATTRLSLRYLALQAREGLQAGCQSMWGIIVAISRGTEKMMVEWIARALCIVFDRSAGWTGFDAELQHKVCHRGLRWWDHTIWEAHHPHSIAKGQLEATANLGS